MLGFSGVLYLIPFLHQTTTKRPNTQEVVSEADAVESYSIDRNQSASYEGVSPARVLSGITNFYDEGIKPKGNVSESYSIRLSKEEYAELYSEVMDHQHRYNRPPFDYALTRDNFYFYNYLGDGDFSVIFAADIVVDGDLIDYLLERYKNGAIRSARCK